MARDTERIDRIAYALRGAKLDGLVCALPANVLLLSGYWPVVGVSIAIATADGAVVLLVMLTVHLSHYTVRHWWWRAPMFAALEAGTEIIFSLALTAVGLEKMGSGVAELSDWLPGATRVLFIRVLVILPFTALLAVVVTIVRRVLLVKEHRTSTAQRVSEARRAVEEPPAPPAA